MLIRENELRLSSKTQEKYKNAELSNNTDWMNITAKLQKRVVKEFGIENIEYGLTNLRVAHLLYPDEKDFKEIPLYVKYNRCRQGDMKCGDTVPNITFKHLNGNLTSLSDFYHSDKPLVIIGGSYT